jgi:hypothetical protein
MVKNLLLALAGLSTATLHAKPVVIWASDPVGAGESVFVSKGSGINS